MDHFSDDVSASQKDGPVDKKRAGGREDAGEIGGLDVVLGRVEGETIVGRG